MYSFHSEGQADLEELLDLPDLKHKGNTFPQNIGNRSPSNTVSDPTSLESSAAHCRAHLTVSHPSAAHCHAHLTVSHPSAAHCRAHLTACIVNVNLNHTGNRNLHQNIRSDSVNVTFTDTCTAYGLVKISSVLLFS